MKKFIKKMITKYSSVPLINLIFFQRKYHTLGLGLVVINIIFQRVFRINSGLKWQIHFTSRVSHPAKIKIYDYKNNASVFLSFSSSGGCYIQANNGIEIHKNVIWAYGVHIISANHSFKDYSIHEKSKPIIIENDVWIGANSVILPKVKIGKFSIIGAGSIVTKDIPSYSIVAGNPAKVIAYRCKQCFDKLETKDSSLVCKSCNAKYKKEDY